MEKIVHSPQQPAIGSPATYSIGSDRYAGEVTAVSPSGKVITIQTAVGLLTFTYRVNSGFYKLKGTDSGFLILGQAVDYRSREF